MSDQLTKQERKFVEIKATTGNGTLAAQKAFGIKDNNYAGVRASKLIRKAKIVNAIEKALPDSLLLKVHREGLNAKLFRYSPEGELMQLDDFATRHKYLDSGYKLKGSYAPEKSLNVNVSIEPSDRIKELAKKLKDLDN